ncbi:hypothetical protein NO1_1056 [Candidatus Termititenax aidoneus]|uniref:Uncharacterized protein n=1 Tax=Termititenax aidoneus TaxID=2218524 RepID=A0A388TB56_TERA1|nr:hypothetical protein NO1_1056 [Candidatus Termititenax aidoneus]
MLPVKKYAAKLAKMAAVMLAKTAAGVCAPAMAAPRRVRRPASIHAVGIAAAGVVGAVVLAPVPGIALMGPIMIVVEVVLIFHVPRLVLVHVPIVVLAVVLACVATHVAILV